MLVTTRVLALCLLAVLAGCSQTVQQINGRPDSYYQKKVRFVAQVSRMQRLPAETLCEVVGERGGRILVKAPAGAEVEAGDWVSVKGLLVPEVRVGDAVLYDVVVVDELPTRRPPLIPDFM